MSEPLFLVTGVSGYVASHIAKQLLAGGNRVRGTVRSKTSPKVAHLDEMFKDSAHPLELVECDLMVEEGWAPALDGVSYVFHTASPVMVELPKDPDEMVKPAVNGTLFVLRAAAASGTVKRVVVTSSVAAIWADEDQKPDHVFTESDWSNPETCDPYSKSKTLAERAAWNFMDELKDGKHGAHTFDLATINPGYVIGPLLMPVLCPSAALPSKFMKKEMPGSPWMAFGHVDVRDLAAAHIRAMHRPEASMKRFICCGPSFWLVDFAKVLAAEFNKQGYSIPTRTIPTWIIWLYSFFDKEVGATLHFIRPKRECSFALAEEVLGLTIRPMEECLTDMAYSMIEFGMIDKTEGYQPRVLDYAPRLLE